MVSQQTVNDFERIINKLIELHSSSFEKMNSYNNLIIGAGYVAYFAIWGNVQSLMDNKQIVTSSLAMILSITFFVGWEIFKMLYSYLSLSNQRKAIEANQEDFVETAQRWELSEKRLSICYSRIYWFFLVPSVSLAFYAFYILVHTFISFLKSS